VKFSYCLLVRDSTKCREHLLEDNMRTLNNLQATRSGFFAMYDKELDYIEFSTDKGYGHNLLVNGEDMGISFEDFSTMIANSQEIRNDFCENISNVEIENFCKKVTRFLYRRMKFCEKISGESKQIEVRQEEIKNDLEEKEFVERELEFTQENVISKEEHIHRLYMFIETVAINFREENYEEVDRLFKKINL